MACESFLLATDVMSCMASCAMCRSASETSAGSSARTESSAPGLEERRGW